MIISKTPTQRIGRSVNYAIWALILGEGILQGTRNDFATRSLRPYVVEKITILNNVEASVEEKDIATSRSVFAFCDVVAI